MKIYILLMLTAIMWGAAPVLDKIAISKSEPLTAVTIRTIAVCISIILFLIFSGQFKNAVSADTKTVVMLSLSGILAGFLAMLTYYAALKIGATSQIIPLAATYPLVTAILSVIILGEAITPMRILGTLLIVAGIWFVRL